MTYPADFEQKLSFDQIRSKLKSFCLSSAGAKWVDSMGFSTDTDRIRTLLKQNLEFRLILEKGENFPSKHFFDGEGWLKKISLAGNWLEAEDFLHISYALQTIIECKRFLDKTKEYYSELHRLS